MGGTVRAEEGWPPTRNHYPRDRQWLIYNNLVRAKSVGSIAQLSGILISI